MGFEAQTDSGFEQMCMLTSLIGVEAMNQFQVNHPNPVARITYEDVSSLLSRHLEEHLDSLIIDGAASLGVELPESRHAVDLDFDRPGFLRTSDGSSIRFADQFDRYRDGRPRATDPRDDDEVDKLLAAFATLAKNKKMKDKPK